MRIIRTRNGPVCHTNRIQHCSHRHSLAYPCLAPCLAASEALAHFARGALLAELSLAWVYSRVLRFPPANDSEGNTTRSEQHARTNLNRAYVDVFLWSLLAFGVDLFDERGRVIVMLATIAFHHSENMVRIILAPCLNPGRKFDGTHWWNRDQCGGRVGGCARNDFIPYHLEHFTERLGLLMIIFLGEVLRSTITR